MPVDLDKLYRDEGWGKITDLVFGGNVRPLNVEPAARHVAQWAFEKLKEAESVIAAQHEALELLDPGPGLELTYKYVTRD